MSQLQQLLLNEKPSKAIVSLNNKPLKRSEKKCISDVAREIESTFAHTVKIINQLEGLDIVQSEQQGRKKLLELTDKGEDYAENLQAIIGRVEPSGIQI